MRGMGFDIGEPSLYGLQCGKSGFVSLPRQQKGLSFDNGITRR
jgi:hypothetical protein